MNHIIKKSSLYITVVLLFTACKKITDINTNPTAANADQVQVEYFINNSIVHAQMNPGVSERAFILYWTAAGRQISDADGATFSWGSYSDEWISEYYSNQSDALNYINSAIDVANQQITAGTQKAYTNNLMQVARIWRAYLLSEMSDNFGPMPINAFQGKNPEFVDVKSVYYYMLDELKDATSKLDLSVSATDVSSEDPAYGFDFGKWQAYGNSLRLRLAMRLSEVDPSKAQSEFEDAAKGSLLTDQSQIFQVQEGPDWTDLSGMYTRSWYQLPEAVTFNNLVINLGSITSKEQIPSVISDPTSQSNAIANIKPANYAGQYYPVQLTTKTNNPFAPYWLDGLPNTIDPRAYQIFYMPGNNGDASMPTVGYVTSVTTGDVNDVNGNKIKTIDAAYTWNGTPDGNWGTKGGVVDGLFQAVNIGSATGMVPSLKNQYRNNNVYKPERVFFGPWETYFLLAEGAERGWASPVSAQAAYETGISKSFEYWGLSQYTAAYIASTDYNRDGTSVNWNHTVEPGNTHQMNYVDGLTGNAGSAAIAYPVNNLYKNGTVRNDHLTKIITQKFIAQTPWLPLETWSDHRRLGLPFFENVVLEAPIQTLPALTSANYMTCSQKFLPQRMKYPSGLQNSNAAGYKQAVDALGGTDDVLTPLWWAQH